jgi:hypothetical protein
MRFVSILLICIGVFTACSTPTPTRTVALDTERTGVHQLIVTTANAVDTQAQPRNGTYQLTISSDATTTLLHVQATGTLLPTWLAAVAGQATFVVRADQRHFIDGDCLRDASGFPPVTMRDILGPMHEFTALPEAHRWQSTTGGAGWQRFQATATIIDQLLTTLQGTGTGRILLPWSEVVQGDISWDYTYQATVPSLVAPTQLCLGTLLDTLPFPPEWVNRRYYAGALLLDAPNAPTPAVATALPLLYAQGWQINQDTTSAQQITLTLQRTNETIHLFVVSNQTGGSDITVITATP